MPLTVPEGVILGAGVSVLGSIVAATFTTRGQRTLAEDQRIWEKRTETYLQYMEVLRQFSDLNGSGQFEFADSNERRQYNTLVRKLDESTSAMLLFASPRIRSMAVEVRSLAKALQEQWSYYPNFQDRTLMETAFKVVTSAKTLRVYMPSDLQISILPIGRLARMRNWRVWHPERWKRQKPPWEI